MSSADEGVAPTKKRKVQRACDNCRNKKIKCDGICMPNSCCSNCKTRRIECTYLQGIDSYSRHYVESLEGRLERMEKLVSKLSGGLDIDLTQGVDGHRSDNDAIQTPSPALEVDQPRASGPRAKARTTPITPPTTVGLATPRTVDSGPHSDEEDSEDDEFRKELTEGLQQLSIGSQASRYHGKSSGFVFMRSAMALKDELEYAGPRPPPQEDEQHLWLDAFVEDDFPVLDERSFPPQDLLNALVDLYFSHINRHLPLLHEPTFKSAIATGQHLRDGGFGATVLLVCANGSRFARADPRVLLDGSRNPHSAGWKWFSLVDKARRLSFAPAKLHDLQIYVLIALFLQGTAAPHTTWAVIGAGIRAAVDVGAHRKKMYTSSPTPTVEEELWRRAFWILVGMEWVLGYGLGRPCSLHPEDIDLALPNECDDEYWLSAGGEPLFMQPLGKPCKVSGFVHSLRLAKLLAVAARTIYLRNKAKTQLEPGHSDEQWEQRVVVELDSALNKWAENLPSHLRWDSQMEDELFLAQAASLKASYYNYQIAIHRSFASSSSRSHSPLSSIVCTNAARSSIQVLNVLYKRTGSPLYGNMGILITSGTILMVNMLGLKRSGRTTNVDRDLVLVRKVIEMLRSLRYEMQVAESLAKMFIEMMSAITEGGHSPASSAQGPGASKGTSPAALSIDGPLREQHTQPPHTSQRPPPGDATNVGSGTGPSASITSARLDAPFRIPPEFEFLLSNPSPFTPPSDADGLGPAAPNLTYTMPTAGSDPGPMQHGPTGHVLLPPAFPHTAYGALSQQAPLQPQHGGAPAGSQLGGASGDNQFYMADGHMFGLEPLLGYDLNESTSLLSSISPGGMQGSDAQAHHYFGVDMDTTMPSGSDLRADGDMPDFAFTAGGQTFLSDFPPVLGPGSEDWGEFFANSNDLNTGH